jgi:hypothetical protein
LKKHQVLHMFSKSNLGSTLMRTNKTIVLFAAGMAAGHYAAALYVEAKAGHYDTNVPQLPVAAITVTASTSSVSAINMHVNSITDVEYAAPTTELWPSLIKRST